MAAVPAKLESSSAAWLVDGDRDLLKECAKELFAVTVLRRVCRPDFSEIAPERVQRSSLLFGQFALPDAMLNAVISRSVWPPPARSDWPPFDTWTRQHLSLTPHTTTAL